VSEARRAKKKKERSEACEKVPKMTVAMRKTKSPNFLQKSRSKNIFDEIEIPDLDNAN